MTKGFAARHYARALFELGSRDNKLDMWLSDLERLTPLAGDPEITAFLQNPRVVLKDKTAVLSRHVPGIDQMVLHLVYLLIERGKVRQLGLVAGEFRQLVDTAHGIARGWYKVAVPLDAAETAHIQRWVSVILKKSVVLTAELDENILGGVVVRVGDKLLDGSTRTTLGNLKQVLTQT